VVIQHADGVVRISELPDKRRRIELVPRDASVFVACGVTETTYPCALIRELLEIDFGFLCATIARDESALDAALLADLFAFVARSDFTGRRLLDFGCGTGASSCVLGRALPETTVVGVDLDLRMLKVARARAEHHRLTNVEFRTTATPASLSPDIGAFDFVVLSAVYEHLLPEERRRLMPALWGHLRAGGVLFVNQTPHRWFPYEHHSTRLPFVNYLPLPLAVRVARRWARQRTAPNRSRDTREHLRGGLRGATERQIISNLGGNPDPVVLTPCLPGLHDRVDLWFSRLNPHRHRRLKRIIKLAVRVVYRLTGTVFAPGITLALAKPGADGRSLPRAAA
jgi:2-polyprenyl-3-methyl-5-hydroxy-6-metoxy-1,4-benzoquinol methylase